MNARRTLSPTIQKMASDIIVDPYGASDWQCWTELLDKARKRNVNLFQDLFMIRGCGTTLTENQKYGICRIGWPYNFNPVIGHATWPDTNTFQWYMQRFWERWGDDLIKAEDLIYSVISEFEEQENVSGIDCELSKQKTQSNNNQSCDESSDGSAATAKHYQIDGARLQPVEMLQDILTPEEFRGWLKGSMFKYFCRAGKKPGEPYERDMAKCLQFNEWLKQAAAGKKINPRE